MYLALHPHAFYLVPLALELADQARHNTLRSAKVYAQIRPVTLESRLHIKHRLGQEATQVDITEDQLPTSSHTATPERTKLYVVLYARARIHVYVLLEGETGERQRNL